MAIPSPQFNISQPQPSVIEEAFRLALATAVSGLIGAPFEKARARREQGHALERQKAGIIQQQGLEEEQAQRTGMIPLTPELGTRLRAARMDSMTSGVAGVGAYAGQTLVPRAQVAAATKATSPVSPERQNLLDKALSIIGVPKIRSETPEMQSIDTGMGSVTLPSMTGPVSELRAAEIEETLPEAIQAGNLATERAQTATLQAQTRDFRLANLYATLTPQDLEEFGSLYDTEADAPISFDDIQLLKTGGRKLAQFPETAKDLERLNTLNRLRSEGKLIRIPLTQDALEKGIRDFTGIGATQILAQFAQMYPFLLYDRPGHKLDLGEMGKVGAWMAGNPDLLEALTASRYARNMDEVMDAEKTSVGPRLSGRALGYLSLIYRKKGLPWEHPEAQIPEEIPEEELRNVGATRMRTSSRRPANADSATSQFPLGGGTNVARGRGALYAGIDISAEHRSTAGFALQQGLQTRLRTSKNPAQLYSTVERDFIESHATPEKAAAFWREAGETDQQVAPLLLGTPAAKLELNERLRFALAALQNARDALQMNK